MLSLALALALQGPPATATTTTNGTTTPDATPNAPTGPTAVLPVTRGTTRQGVGVVAVAAPGAPWAVVQVHLRLGADVSPRARAATAAWLSVLAEAGRRFVGPTGAIEARVTPDSAAVSFGVEAARVDDALRAVDAALRARGVRPGIAAGAAGTLAVVDDGLDARSAAVLFAGHPLSLPTAGGVLDAAVVKDLGEAVTVDRVVVVVVADDSGAGLLARVNRVVTAPLGKASGLNDLPAQPATARVEFPGTGWTSTMTWSTTQPPDASLLVLSSLLAGRSISAVGVWGFAVDVAANDRAGLLAKEAAVLDQIAGVAAAAPPAEVVERARGEVLRERFSVLNNPDRVAWALGRAALGPKPNQIEEEFAALSTTTPQQVAQAAARLAQASLLIVRSTGVEAPLPLTPTPTTPLGAKALPTMPARSK